MASLSDLPVELLLDNIFPYLHVRDLLVLGATNHQFATLCDDDTFWKLRCKEDYNFSGSRTARTAGWKVIYKQLSNTNVYVWGASGQGRLGLQHVTHGRSGGVPYPMRLDFPKKTAIVDIIAGGWSFHALDSQGNIFVWGTLDGEMFSLQSDGFSVPQKVSETPLKLQLPAPIRALSCGRKHSMALDANGQIWTFISWGRPFRLVTPALDKSSPSETPVQAECGWSYSAALTASGDVFVWWPFGDSVQQVVTTTNVRMDQEGDKRAHATADGAIPCVTWDLHHDPRRLPAIPRLPDLPRPSRAYGEDERQETKLVKIAGMDNFLVGLTNKGHVLKFGDLSNELSLEQGRWEYLPFFSETGKVRIHPTFSEMERKEGEEKPNALAPPMDVEITHITAHFRRFVAYTTEANSIVLQGSTDTTAEDAAEIIPALQYKSVISVVLGDYHSAALTVDGKLYTWGGFSLGALGLGAPETLQPGVPGGYRTQAQLDRARQGHRISVENVEVPTEVRFNHGKKKLKAPFCFAAAAAGWHTGALVIDLEPTVCFVRSSSINTTALVYSNFHPG
ncbi:RCC1/BLIP-II [Phellopilus nigrolimitatus]|nr:RCC1/BLIP-II [Phellopilus nigrolimitatus]